MEELRRHVKLANTLYSDEDVMSSTRRSSLGAVFTSSGNTNNNRSKSTVADIVMPLHHVADITLPPPPASPAQTTTTTSDAAAAVDTNNTSTGTSSASPTASVSVRNAPITAPAPIKFWTQKKGHINLGMKPRYFVLHAGLLSYYVESIDTPPFGKDFKGYATSFIY